MWGIWRSAHGPDTTNPRTGRSGPTSRSRGRWRTRDRRAVTPEHRAADGGTRGAASRPAEPEKQRSFWKELPLLIGIALVLALLIKTFLVQAFSIPSDSMQNTLQQGDRVLVDKLTPWFGSEPERGEVVVFHDPGGWLDGRAATPEPNAAQKVLSFIGLMPSAEEKDLIKRVIAVGGDTVECKGTGPVKVNGKALTRLVHLSRATPRAATSPFGPIKVTRGPDLGHGRPPAELPGLPLPPEADTNQGTVPVDEVVGRAIVVAWPRQPLVHAAGPGHLRPARTCSARRSRRARPRGRGAAGAVAPAPPRWRRRRERLTAHAYRRVGCRPRSPTPRPAGAAGRFSDWGSAGMSGTTDVRTSGRGRLGSMLSGLAVAARLCALPRRVRLGRGRLPAVHRADRLDVAHHQRRGPGPRPADRRRRGAARRRRRLHGRAWGDMPDGQAGRRRSAATRSPAATRTAG